MNKTLRLASMLFLSITAVVPATTMAAYPDKPVKMIVGFPPGGVTDVIARAVAHDLTKKWGQQVIVDNRPGAGGTLGTTAAAKSDNDGYTILMATSSTHGVAQSLYKRLGYDTVKDFAPISLVASSPNVLVVSPSLPVKSVKELVAYAKANPDKLNFASTGRGTASHLAGELFKDLAGIQMTHVPYKGSAQAYPDIFSGQVQVMFDYSVSAMPHVKSGKLRALAVTTRQRNADIGKDIPTVIESGVPNFEAVLAVGLLAPAGTPPALVNKISQDVAAIMRTPAMKARMKDLGAVAVGSTPAQYAAQIQSDLNKWGRVVKASGAAEE